MIEVKIAGLVRGDAANKKNASAVILANDSGENDVTKAPRVIIVINNNTFNVILDKFKNKTSEIPTIYETFAQMTTKMNYSVKRLNINDFADGVYYSSMELSGPDGNVTMMKIRTSDGIALALHSGAPIYVAEKLLSDNKGNSDIVKVLSDSLDAETGKKHRKKEEKELFKDCYSEHDLDYDYDKIVTGKKEFAKLSMKELDIALKIAIKREDYLMASKLRDERNKRNENL